MMTMMMIDDKNNYCISYLVDKTNELKSTVIFNLSQIYFNSFANDIPAY